MLLHRINETHCCAQHHKRAKLGKLPNVSVVLHMKNHSKKANITPITHRSNTKFQEHTHGLIEGTHQVPAGHKFHTETFAKSSLLIDELSSLASKGDPSQKTWN